MIHVGNQGQIPAKTTKEVRKWTYCFCSKEMRWLENELMQTGLAVFRSEKGQDHYIIGVPVGHGNAYAH